MLKLGSVMIGSKNPRIMGEFYTKVFGRTADMIEGSSYGWKVGDTFLVVGEHGEVADKAREPQRVLFNFETDQVKEEFDRIKALGATVVKEPYNSFGPWIATLSDPDGNFFQLMSPWKPK